MCDIQDSLIEVANFTPSFVQPSAWFGHIPFAAWLIKSFKPNIFVELGTHWGHSYFSFCHTVCENDLNTKCYAVDTWKGEKHAGFYGEEVFQHVFAYNQDKFSSFSRLLRMDFDEAINYFSDQSVDLLHIDGLHTYEAVKHDYEKWVPKLAPGAIVLFHDINVREQGFGVWKLWEELKDCHPNNLEFIHSHGLGVLQMDNGPDERNLKWLQDSSILQKRLQNYFSALGARQTERFEISQLREQISSFNQAVSEKDGHIATLNQVLSEKDSHLATLNQAISEKDSHLAALNQAISEKDSQITTLNQAISGKDQEVTTLYKSISEKDREINEIELGIVERDEIIKNLNNLVENKDHHINKLTQEISILRNSTTWKITKPLRWSFYQLKRSRKILGTLNYAVKLSGGPQFCVSKALRLFRTEGLSGLKHRFLHIHKQRDNENNISFKADGYQEWIKHYDMLTDDSRQRIRMMIKKYPRHPKISVLMPVYDPPLKFLEEAIWSVRNQLYSNWELCISDDASINEDVRELLRRHSVEDKRIKVVYREVNGHISAASNSALELATGDYIALLDHDDLLSEHSLFWILKAIIENPNADLLYSDEDKIDEDGRRSLPFFKPDWSPHLAISQAYLGHLICIKKNLIDSVGRWDNETIGAQDYDLWLRISLKANQIVHISKILYHWRIHKNSTSKDADSKPYANKAGLIAVKNYLEKRYPKNKIVACEGESLFTYKAKFNLDSGIMASIIIPTKDRLDYLMPCIDSIISVSSWKNFEILIIDNGSRDDDAINYLKNINKVDERIRVVEADLPFNWSRLNNIAFNHCKGDILIFLNNDIEVISEDWIQYLSGYAGLPDVGTVGGLLFFEDGTIQHCGVVVGMGGWADHVYKQQPAIHYGGGPFVSPVLTRDVLAVTGACMAISRDKFNELGGFNEDFIICGSDVELCLRAHSKGLYNVMCAEVKMTHYESKTRTTYIPEEDFLTSAQKYEPYRTEKVDPFFNPNLSLRSTLPIIEMKPDKRHDTENY